MFKVALIGQGNVSFHLESTFTGVKEVECTIYNSRDENLGKLVNSSDVCIVAVSDSAIKGVSKKLLPTNALIAHTSGSVSMKELPDDGRRGVFYPLQTLSSAKSIDFSKVPICIEAESLEDREILLKLANYISSSVHQVSSEQRKSLHLAAVFANNFTNHMYQTAHDICEENKLSFDLIRPLIHETSNKIMSLTPFEAQTGPAKRNDQATIKSQQNQIEDSERRELYSKLSKSIQKVYGQKL